MCMYVYACIYVYIYVYVYIYIYIYIYGIYGIWSIPTKVMHIGKKTTLLHSPEFSSLYNRHMELSQKIYASSYMIVIVAT